MKKYVRFLLPCAFCLVTMMASLRFGKLMSEAIATKISKLDHEKIAVNATPNEIPKAHTKTDRQVLLLDRLKSYDKRAKTVVEGICRSAIFGQSCLRRFDARITKLITGRPRARQVIFGKGGWLFYNPDGDADPIGDYRGEIRYERSVLEDCRDCMRRMSSWCQSRNITFCVLVLPNKEVMYDEYMPLSIQRHSTVTRTDVLIDYLKKNSSAKIVYPKGQLRAAKSICNVYYPTDTHWNLVGAYIGVQELLATLGMQHREVKQEDIGRRENGHRGDLIKLGCLENEGYPEDEELVIKGTPILKRDSKWNEYCENRNDDAPHKERIIIVGDSFRTAMLPSLSREFQFVCDVHRHDAKDFVNHVEKANPDIIVLEFVERYAGAIGDTVKDLIGM